LVKNYNVCWKSSVSFIYSFHEMKCLIASSVYQTKIFSHGLKTYFTHSDEFFFITPNYFISFQYYLKRKMNNMYKFKNKKTLIKSQITNQLSRMTKIQGR
jgi:hypothetical protein